MDKTIPTTITFIGALGLLAWWISTRVVMPMTASPDSADYWLTPYYLRANTPVFDTSVAVLPTVPDDSFFALQGWALPNFYGSAG